LTDRPIIRQTCAILPPLHAGARFVERRGLRQGRGPAALHRGGPAPARRV